MYYENNKAYLYSLFILTHTHIYIYEMFDKNVLLKRD